MFGHIAMDAEERQPKRVRISEDINEYALRQGYEIVDPMFLDTFSDVKAAITLILNRTPQQTLYPRMIIKHQLYCIIRNKTEVKSAI